MRRDAMRDAGAAAALARNIQELGASLDLRPAVGAGVTRDEHHARSLVPLRALASGRQSRRLGKRIGVMIQTTPEVH